LEGKVKNPRHRPKSYDAEMKRCAIIQHCLLQQKRYPRSKRADIVFEVSELYQVSETYVAKVWKQITPRESDVMNEFLDAILEKSEPK
jgi:hypothetical protein